MGDGPDNSERDAEIAQEKQDRANKLNSLEKQRFAIIKSEGAPIWNSLQTDNPVAPIPTPTEFGN